MRKALLLVLVAITFMTVVYAEKNNTTDTNTVNTNFLVSSLTANDVNCKKCHTDIPHVIHARKAEATCEKCHGDKLSVAIPQCTKCHNGPIHKVHAGKINKGCEYCHKNIAPIHTNLIGEAVCSHCHKDLIQVHGEDQSCTKCHKTPPEIVKPLKAEGMVLVCQNCHPSSSIATIHGSIEEKQGCYNCHKGASQLSGSDVPHNIHQDKASCKDCHQDNGKVVVPQCIKCHKIDELHAFDKIGKLTTQSGLECSICHADISKSAKGTVAEKADIGVTEKIGNNGIDTANIEEIVKETQTVSQPDGQKEGKEGQKEEQPKMPGFDIVPGIIILYVVARKIKNINR